MAAPVTLPIDWSKPNLRLGYLVEGVYRDPAGGRHLVRWCGPKSRTGSGISARAVVDGDPIFDPLSGTSSGIARPTLTTARVPFEARLSRCMVDKTLGTLKQHIQAQSDITFKVDIGDDDLGRVSTSPHWVGYDGEALIDMATLGRWRGQPVLFSIVDLDNVDHMEVFARGTWDRDPTNIKSASFKMTIDAQEALPPTLNWPMYQVPKASAASAWTTVPQPSWVSGPSPLTSNDNARAPLFYYFNDAHPGLWMGQIYGGAPLAISPSPDPLWRELVHYGSSGGAIGFEYHFVLVSPRFDQFCYDVAFENTSGEVILASAVGYIFVFNNENPNWGPLGTCAKFMVSPGSVDFRAGRIFGRVAGGPGVIARRAAYGAQFPSGLTDLGTNGGSGEAVPYQYGTGGDVWAETVFAEMITSLLGGELLPGYNTILWDFLLAVYPYTASAPGYAWRRSCAVPAQLQEEPLQFRHVMASFMQTIPADLVMRTDRTSDYERKFCAVPRQQPGDPAVATFTEADLYQSTPPRGVEQEADPDGIYSNEITITTSDFFDEPDTTEDVLEVPDRRLQELRDLSEQGSAKTGQVITDDAAFLDWNWPEVSGFLGVASLLATERSRPQPVLKAMHGYPSFRFELGDVIEYDIRGVYKGPGQIRSLLLDLDKQAVTVRSYHQIGRDRGATSAQGAADLMDKGEQEAAGDKPDLDRMTLGVARPAQD